MITQEQVRKLFDYNPETGILTNKTHRNSRAKKGETSGCTLSTGYLQVTIDRKRYLAHRLCFLHYHGYLPKILDHVDNIKHHNMIDNLRAATTQENAFNKKISSNNTSGVKGVFWDGTYNKWRASISINGKKRYFGSYYDIEDARKAVEDAREKHHGEFARHD